MFLGNLHHDSVTLATKTLAANGVRMVVSTSPTLSGTKMYFGPVTPVDRAVKITATGLSPRTQYYYSLETDGVMDSTIGRFRTPSRPGEAFSFDFWASSCAEGWTHPGSKRLTSNSPVYDEIMSLNPLFGLHMGDMHYRNIEENKIEVFEQAYDDVLRQPRQANLYRNVPMTYTWDDHDFGPNNSNKNSPSKVASQAAYRKRIPHYDLPSSIGQIYQTYTIGRCRFIHLDVRSERDPISTPAGPSKTILGTEQKNWLKSTLLSATEPVIFLEVSVPWVADWQTDDDWWHYQNERTELASFMKSNGISDRVIILAGDAHMLAIDDGRNNVYGNMGSPVFQLASLDSHPSIKGGPYSIPAISGSGQFGIIKVRDNGTNITVHVEGRMAV